MKKIIISLAFLLAFATGQAQVNWTTVGWTPQIRNVNGYREFRGGLGASGFFNFTDTIKKVFLAIENAPFVKNQNGFEQTGSLWLSGDIQGASIYGTAIGITGGATFHGDVQIQGYLALPNYPINSDAINNTDLLSQGSDGKVRRTSSANFVNRTLSQSIGGLKTFTSDVILGTLAGIGVRSIAVDEDGKLVIGSGGGGGGGVSLGETSSTAYRGDRGKIAYDYALAHNLVDNTSDASKPISTAQATALAGKANTATGNTFSGTNNFDAVNVSATLNANGGSVSADFVGIKKGGYRADLTVNTLTASRVQKIQDKNGTVALLDPITNKLDTANLPVVNMDNIWFTTNSAGNITVDTVKLNSYASSHGWGSGGNYTPAPPTSSVVDDVTKTFNWTNTSGFTSLGDYEYTVNGGSTQTVVTAKPFAVSGAKAIGQVGVRVKAYTGRNASSWLYNTTAFTSGSSYLVEKSFSINFTGEYASDVTQSGITWNNWKPSNSVISGAAGTATITALKSEDNVTSTIAITNTAPFGGSSGNEASYAGDESVFPAGSINGGFVFSSTTGFKITGLDPAKYYQISFLAASDNSGSATGINVNGGTAQSKSAYLNYPVDGSDRFENAAMMKFYNIVPNGSGEATITVTKDGAYYQSVISAMRILQTNIAKP